MILVISEKFKYINMAFKQNEIFYKALGITTILKWKCANEAP